MVDAVEGISKYTSYKSLAEAWQKDADNGIIIQRRAEVARRTTQQADEKSIPEVISISEECTGENSEHDESGDSIRDKNKHSQLEEQSLEVKYQSLK